MNNVIYKLIHIFPILRERIARYLKMPLYASIQYETESSFHNYIKSTPEQIKKIIVVGAYLGLEFPRLLKNYPNAHLYAFEPNPSYYSELVRKFKSNDNVHLMNIAVSSSEGTAIFNDGSKPGTGSLLELSRFAVDTYGVESVGIHEVETVSLDKLFSNSISLADPIDLLWIDVQGAEMLVLKGAVICLENVKAVFIEVSVLSPIAENGALMGEINRLLYQKSFTLVGLGLDNKNLTGNALFIKHKGSI